VAERQNYAFEAMSETTSPIAGHWRAIAAVFAGGAIGTLLRAVLLAHVTFGLSRTNVVCPPTAAHCVGWASLVPWTLLLINAVGVYGATRLLAGPLRERGFFDQWLLLAITGFFGGLTSYSALYIALASMWHTYPLGAVIAGLTAVLSGVVAAGLALGNSR